MPLARRLLPLLLVLTACLLPLVAAAQPQPQRHRFPGGLTVITAENHEAPVVAIQVWVRAGSAFERPSEWGVTHLIEHMIFKGTPNHPGEQMAGRVEGLGGMINAYTTFDHTNYYTVVSSQNATEALDLLADSVLNADFAPEELKKEREVVIEEIRMNQDDPGRRRSKALFQLAYGNHPYGHPVIGFEQIVRDIGRDEILAYKHRWYRANGMIVVVVGDFDTKTMLPAVREAFATADRQPTQEFKIPDHANLEPGPRLEVLREDVKQAAITLAWSIPGLPSPEVYPLDVAASVLGQGPASRLWTQLKEKQRLVDSVSAHAFTPEALGQFMVSASLSPDKVNQAWPELLKQSLSLISQPAQAGELERARVGLEASFIRDRLTMQGQADTLGTFEMFYGGFEQAETYMQRFGAVEPRDISATLARYLKPENLSVVIQLPVGAPAPDLAAIQKAARETFANLGAPATGDDAQPRLVKLDNGLQLILSPRHAVPVVEYALVSPLGQAAADPATAGLPTLWANMLTRGSQGLSHEALNRELEGLGASLDAGAGRDQASLSGSFLSRDWRRGLELMHLVWTKPTFEPQQLERAKLEQAAGLRQQQDSPVAMASLRFKKLLYGDHPYALNPLGTMANLRGFDPAALKAWHRRTMGPGGLVLAVVGDFDPAVMEAAVRARWGGDQGQVQAPPVPPLAALTGPKVEHQADADAKQNQVLVGYVVPGEKDPRRYALSVTEAVLGGMGGRLFRDLRDKQSLAYSVDPFYAGYEAGGVFGVYMGVGPGKTAPALAGIDQHLKALAQGPVPADELERAKTYLAGLADIGMQTYGAQAMTMASDQLEGLGYLHHRQRAKLLRQVDAAQLQKVAAEFLAGDHRVVYTQGPDAPQP